MQAQHEPHAKRETNFISLPRHSFTRPSNLFTMRRNWPRSGLRHGWGTGTITGNLLPGSHYHGWHPRRHGYTHVTDPSVAQAENLSLRAELATEWGLYR